MKKIDTYIIKKILVTFVFSLILLVVVSVAINTSEQISNFVKSGLGVWGIIEKHFAGFIPFIIITIFPIIVFISIIIITSRMSVHSEIIAFRASGASYIRFLYPYIMAGALLMLVHWMLINLVLPKANQIRADFQEIYVNGKQGKGANDFYSSLYLRSNANTFVIFKNYSSYQKRAAAFFIDEIKHHQLKKRISGRNMEWIEDKRKWRGENLFIQEHTKDRHIKESHVDTMYFEFAFTPHDAVLDFYFKDKLYRSELAQYIDKEKVKGTDVRLLQLELYKRDATPLVILLLSIIAAMLSSKKVRGGSGYHIAIGIILMAIYVFLERISSIFATKASFPPLLAAWSPHLIFVIIAIVIYRMTYKSPV